MEGHENVDICITGGASFAGWTALGDEERVVGERGERREVWFESEEEVKVKVRSGQVKSSHAFTPPPISHHQQRGCTGSCIPGATAAPNSSSKDLLLVTVAYPAGGSAPDRLNKQRRWGENCAGLGITCADISPLQPSWPPHPDVVCGQRETSRSSGCPTFESFKF